MEEILELEERTLNKMNKLLNNFEGGKTMNNKELVKHLVNNTIENEFYRLDEDITDLKKVEDYLNLSEKYIELEENLYKILPKEYHSLIEELTGALNLMLGVEKRYMFKQGVIKGLTDLNYLEEVGQMIMFI
ncbi:hypothetical protein [Clostridium botulinum]|uniref:hypothetical protein n=1 Tax=Clostridium botulinum TaxID=1491 RepID=UPI0007DF89DE|nr:hypothetical protein [Clostridium botulinum]KEI83373.1 hypothetical protein N487_00180 [Clostridium botulinum B2 331]KEI93967.1 hypothetical protein N491_00180 [Clostridium botulinum B2 275]NFA91057.1 hypothetical protein [Clostridium botulinum]NFB21247.1 hypothetical protein [Clostridium botulinum]NFT58418.1 hypothetical protein [Clostridium botulinum]